jgi:hypothetical protein
MQALAIAGDLDVLEDARPRFFTSPVVLVVALLGLERVEKALLDGVVVTVHLSARQVHERSGGRQRPTVPRIRGGEDFPLARVP